MADPAGPIPLVCNSSKNSGFLQMGPPSPLLILPKHRNFKRLIERAASDGNSGEIRRNSGFRAASNTILL